MQHLQTALILCVLWASVVPSAFAKPTAFTYDALNQLTSYRAGATTLAFRYDGLGSTVAQKGHYL